MENNGNKPRGILILLFTLFLSIITIYGVLSLSLGKDMEKWSYDDPLVSRINIRGNIYDRNGKLIAIQTPQLGFSIVNSDGASQRISSFIAPYLNSDGVHIARRISEGVTFFPVEAESAPAIESISVLIAESGLEEYVEYSEKEVRSYPYHVMENIIGYSSLPSRGEGGIEELFNSDLAAFPEVGRTTVKGSSITLTLDVEIQMILETIIEELGFESDAALYNEKGQILAYSGKYDESVANSLVRYMTTSGNEKIERDVSLPSRFLNAIPLGPYMLFVEGKDYESLLERLELILKEKGKI